MKNHFIFIATRLLFGSKPGQVGARLYASAAQWDLRIVKEPS
jgi:hypothetical protein